MRFEFQIGSSVLVEEGEAGKLKFIVLDPEDSEATDLIVERGLLLTRSIVVPVSWVESVTEEGIRLNASIKDLDDLPAYREIDFLEPLSNGVSTPYSPEDIRVWAWSFGMFPELGLPMLVRHIRMGVDDKSVLVGRGTEVQSLDGKSVGKVDHVIVEPTTHDVTHIVVHPRFRITHGGDVAVSIDQVKSVSDSAIRLNLTKEEFDTTPRYTRTATDRQLETRINRALKTQPETRDYAIRAEVDGGVARLLGDIPTSVSQAASAIARKIHGVISVEDRTRQLSDQARL